MRKSGAALLFDIDGTLADTDAFHLAAFNQVFARKGHSFDRTRFSRELQGFSMAHIEQKFLGDEPQARRSAIMAEKEAVFRKLAGAHIKPVPGLASLLDFAVRQGFALAAVTNAPRLNAELVLDGLCIADMFQVVVSADELPHGKPHPLPYLESLRRLGADPATSIAFEVRGQGSARRQTQVSQRSESPHRSKLTIL